MAMFPVHLDVSFGGDSDGARSPPRSSACTSNNERRTSVTDITDPSSAPATSDVPQSRSFSFSFKPFRSNSTSHADSPGISGSPNNQQSPPSPLEDDENLPQSISANKSRTAGRLGSLLSGSLCPTNPKDPADYADFAGHQIEQTDLLTEIRLSRAARRRSSHKHQSEQEQTPIYPVRPQRTDGRETDLVGEFLDFWTVDAGMSN